MQPKQASNIDEVIKILYEIIQESKNEKSPKGYFTGLYRKVTLKVKEGIASGYFEDGPRMEKLDAIFANRYITAYYQNKNGESTSLSWEMAFKLSTKFWPIVLQHLLIGMNAHISLDLGIAAAKVMAGKDINNLKGDFDKINEVLSELVADVEKDLSEIWPALKVLLKLNHKIDDFLIDFSIKIARTQVCKFATSLADKS